MAIGSKVSIVDRPFALPHDSSETILDIPTPPSVNRTRKINWRGHRKYDRWKQDAAWHLAGNGQRRKAAQGVQQYELTITFDRQLVALDPDNAIKAAIDFLRYLGVIADDGPQFAERIVIQWGEAPDGCRLTVRSLHR